MTYHYKYLVNGFRETLVLLRSVQLDGFARKYWGELVFVVILQASQILCVFTFLFIYFLWV